MKRTMSLITKVLTALLIVVLVFSGMPTVVATQTVKNDFHLLDGIAEHEFYDNLVHLPPFDTRTERRIPDDGFLHQEYVVFHEVTHSVHLEASQNRELDELAADGFANIVFSNDGIAQAITPESFTVATPYLFKLSDAHTY